MLLPSHQRRLSLHDDSIRITRTRYSGLCRSTLNDFRSRSYVPRYRNECPSFSLTFNGVGLRPCRELNSLLDTRCDGERTFAIVQGPCLVRPSIYQRKVCLSVLIDKICQSTQFFAMLWPSPSLRQHCLSSCSNPSHTGPVCHSSWTHSMLARLTILAPKWLSMVYPHPLSRPRVIAAPRGPYR